MFGEECIRTHPSVCMCPVILPTHDKDDGEKNGLLICLLFSKLDIIFFYTRVIVAGKYLNQVA